MTPKLSLLLLGLIYFFVSMATAAPGLSTEAAAEDSKTGTTKPENGETAAPEKEKRSQEEIMFGNQQNKPAGMMDDMVAFPDRKDKASSPDTDNATGSSGNASSTESASKDHQDNSLATDEDKKTELPTNERDDDDDRFDYYDYLDDGADFRLDDDGYKSGSAGDRADYQYDDGSPLYRRKRNLQPKSAHRRTLRSSLEELLVGGKRLPRRALRFKRDVDVNDLLAMFGALLEQEANDRYYPEDEDSKPYNLMKEIPEVSEADFRSPYEGVGGENDNELAASRLLEELPPTEARELPPYLTESYNRDAAPEWLLGSDSSPYSAIVRRSASFYPQDYRHALVPGHRKRRWEAIDREPHSEIGRWGRMEQRRAAPAIDSEDDMERLYDLASLLEDARDEDNPYWNGA